MSNNYNSINNINKIFETVSIKKQYIKNLKNQVNLLSDVKQKNYKLLNSKISSIDVNKCIDDQVVMYIINIIFSRSNTFLNVTDPSGNLKFFCSAGCLQHKGKNKKFRFNVFKNIYHVLTTKLRFLKGKPIALHLKNVGFNKHWLIKKLKSRFFIKSVKSFNIFPHNGCRKRKVRRKKLKKKMKKWLSGLKRQTVNLLSFLIGGSNPSFFN